ncbi:MAG: hypothetical protein JXB39_11475 [Deltaproteobacteria bacterium]|nr:hypothetical protein [Deltaproteobacteria bacterium]
MLPLLLAACSGPVDFASCTDAPCIEEAVLAGWGRDPAATAARVAAIEDPVVRLAAVTTLAEAHPGETRALCRALPEGEARRRCDDVNGRLHLAPRPADAARSGSATPASDPLAVRGPSMTLLLPSRPLGSVPLPWARVASVDVDCPHPLLSNVCGAEAAEEAARLGAWARAIGACRGLEPGPWRDECAFQAAEAALETHGSAAGGEAALLCLESGAFSPSCLAHAAMALGGRAAPAADDASRGAWNAVLEGERAMSERLVPIDPILARRVSERLWSEATLASYQRAVHLVGNPLDVLPPVAAPHVRAALAWRLWAMEGRRARTLADWQARIDRALGDRSDQTRPVSEPVPRLRVITLWEVFLPGEAQMPTVLYLGQARRAVAEDPSTDALLCLLEAAARLSLPTSPAAAGATGSPDAGLLLFAEALDHPVPVVRWTAGRLLAAIDAQGRYVERLEQHPDPRVRAQRMRPALHSLASPPEVMGPATPARPRAPDPG